MSKRLLSAILVCVMIFSYLFVPINIVAETDDFSVIVADGKSKIRYYYTNQDVGSLENTYDKNEFEENLEQNDKVLVMFELNVQDHECNCRNSITKNSTKEEVRSVISNHKDEMKLLFSSINEDFIEKNGELTDYDISIAEYAPYIIISFDNYSEYLECEDQVFKIAADMDVCSVSVSENIKYEGSAAIRTDSSNASAYYLDDAIEDIEASSQEYDGYGVKIGIIEAEGVANAGSHADLQYLTIRTNKPAGVAYTVSYHAIEVTRVLCGINGVATGVEDVYTYHTPTAGAFISAMEWMVDNEVNVINMSLGITGTEDNGFYHWTSAVLDFYIRTYFITCVASAGNDGKATGHTVDNYSMAENVISVSATDVTNSISTYSSYGVADAINLRRPTISAPGTKIRIGSDLYEVSGTSIAAPVVSGVVAKLMDEDPWLMTYPEAVHACLIASATPVRGQGHAWDIYAGAGRVSYERAREAVWNCRVFNNRSNVQDIVESYGIVFPISSRIRVAAVWLLNSETEVSGDTIYSNAHTNYDLNLKSTTTAYSVYDSNRTTNAEFITVYHPGGGTSFKINIEQNSNIFLGEEDVGAYTWITE